MIPFLVFVSTIRPLMCLICFYHPGKRSWQMGVGLCMYAASFTDWARAAWGSWETGGTTWRYLAILIWFHMIWFHHGDNIWNAMNIWENDGKHPVWTSWDSELMDVSLLNSWWVPATQPFSIKNAEATTRKLAAGWPNRGGQLASFQVAKTFQALQAGVPST